MAVSAETTIERNPKNLPKWFIVKAFILCLSFANLSFLTQWTDLLNRQTEVYRKYAVTWQQLAAVTLDVVLLALLLWITVCLIVKSGYRMRIRILKWSVLVGLLFTLNVIRLTSEVSSLSSLPALQALPVRILFALLGFFAGIVLLWKWEKLSSSATATIFAVLAPMLPLVVATVAWGIYTGPPAGRLPDKPSAAVLPQKAGAPHVLWIVFDEWDAALTFRRRPAHLELPELDRFRAESFHVERAFTPSRRTIVSVPSLITGKVFIDANPNGASDLLLTYAPNLPPERFAAESTVFSEARGGGFNVGIVGFYLPYCRIFGTTSCESHSAIGFLPVEWEHPLSLAGFVVLEAKREIPMVPLARRLGVVRLLGEEVLQPVQHAVTYRQIHEEALHSIVDPRLNLVFIHWNIPHPPIIYDAAKDDLSSDPANTYGDNLRLVDRTVRDIRLALEKAGIWDSSTILMTSDHPLRLRNWARSILPRSVAYLQGSDVPFMLKMAGQKRGFAYDRAMETVVTKDLLLAIMKGDISKPKQVAAWLDQYPQSR